MYSAFAQYQNTQVNTSSPEKILLMLYDGAIRFTRVAIERMSKGDVQGKGLYISKAQAIVAELMNTLNREIGGEVAVKLDELYLFVIDAYVTANASNSATALENALGILTTLRDAWYEAVVKVKPVQQSWQPQLARG